MLDRVMELDGVTTMAALIIMGMKLLNPMKKLKGVVLLKMRPVLVLFKMSMTYLQHQLTLVGYAGSLFKFTFSLCCMDIWFLCRPNIFLGDVASR